MRFPSAFLLLAALLGLLTTRPLRAGEAWPPPFAAAPGGFQAELWVVEGRAFFKDWRSGRREPFPAVVPQHVRGNGTPLFAAVSFAGPAADGSGLAHVRYHLRVLRPDGSIYAHQPEALGLLGWAGPCAGLFPRLGRDSVAVVPERTDPPGFYLVEARVRDAVANVELPVLRASFLVR